MITWYTELQLTLPNFSTFQVLKSFKPQSPSGYIIPQPWGRPPSWSYVHHVLSQVSHDQRMAESILAFRVPHLTSQISLSGSSTSRLTGPGPLHLDLCFGPPAHSAPLWLPSCPAQWCGSILHTLPQGLDIKPACLLLWPLSDTPVSLGKPRATQSARCISSSASTSY